MDGDRTEARRPVLRTSTPVSRPTAGLPTPAARRWPRRRARGHQLGRADAAGLRAPTVLGGQVLESAFPLTMASRCVGRMSIGLDASAHRRPRTVCDDEGHGFRPSGSCPYSTCGRDILTRRGPVDQASRARAATRSTSGRWHFTEFSDSRSAKSKSTHRGRRRLRGRGRRVHHAEEGGTAVPCPSPNPYGFTCHELKGSLTLVKCPSTPTTDWAAVPQASAATLPRARCCQQLRRAGERGRHGRRREDPPERLLLRVQEHGGQLRLRDGAVDRRQRSMGRHDLEQGAELQRYASARASRPGAVRPGPSGAPLPSPSTGSSSIPGGC